jgi:hypothetical protein
MTGVGRLAYRLMAPPLARLIVVLWRWGRQWADWAHQQQCELCQLAIIPERRCLHWHIQQREFEQKIDAAQRQAAAIGRWA